MPHSLYLGSGIVQSRLRDFDNDRNAERTGSNETANVAMPAARQMVSLDSDAASEVVKYRPSLAAIRSCLNYSIAELAVSLFTFALFVNSAILIVSGASLSNLPASQTDSTDLFSIHALLSSSIAPIAGTIFALALLLSGTSAGIVCTIAGQMVSEGQLNWTIRPWIRRLITRTISIVPSIIIAGAVGREGLSAALVGSQVALSVVLPFVSAPLIYFTWNARIMTVAVERDDDQHPKAKRDDDLVERGAPAVTVVVMKNSLFTGILALCIWGVLVIMNVALLVLVGLKAN
jgi:metal iron transporter